MRIYKEKNRGRTAPVWTVALADQYGRRRKFAGFPDKATTRELGRKLERLVAARVAGLDPDGELRQWLEHIPVALHQRLVKCALVDAFSAEAVKPLMIAKRKAHKRTHIVSFEVTGGHLADYREHMRCRELAPQHISQVISHCARFFDARKLRFPCDLTTSHLEAHITSLRQTGASARTANSALAAAKSFCRWMVREGRMADNPAARISKLNERADRRLIRRALTPEEARVLIRHTPQAGIRHGCTGSERSLIYRLALCTGLRLNEIRTLERSDLDLEASRPTVTVQPRNEKAKRGAVLPLSGDATLAADLRNHFAAHPLSRRENTGDRAFPNLPPNGAEMLRADMRHARKRERVVQYRACRREGMDRKKAREEVDALYAADFLQAETRRGVVDFHALRHTFGTWLARSGVHPKVCQEMMRHASIETTMQLYTHTLLDDKDQAARALPDIGAGSGEKGAAPVVGVA